MTEQHIRCPTCGKMIAMRLEGELEFYCPRCHVHHTIVASTAMQTHLHVPGGIPAIEIRYVIRNGP